MKNPNNEEKSQENKENSQEKGQENHYIWLMAKFREKINENLKKINIELDEDLSRFHKEISEISLKNDDFIIKRFDSCVENMQYGNQRSDCISFIASEDVLCNGIGVYKNFKAENNWNILVMIKEGGDTGGIVMKKQLFRVKNHEENMKDFISNLMFDKSVEILKDKKYTVYLLINGPNSWKGVGGRTVVKDKIVVKFYETLHLEKDPKNATGVSMGQIPLLFFSVNK